MLSSGREPRQAEIETARSRPDSPPLVLEEMHVPECSARSPSRGCELADDVHHRLPCLTNGAGHFPSRLANGASHLSSRTTLSAGRLSSRLASSARDLPSCSPISACYFPSGPASSTRNLPSGPAGGACRLARSSLCRRHSCSPLSVLSGRTLNFLQTLPSEKASQLFSGTCLHVNKA